MKHFWISTATCLALLSLARPAWSHPLTKLVLIQVGVASAASIRLATATKDDDPLTLAARHAADDPSPAMGSLQLIESVRIRDEHEWETAFSADMGSAFQGAADAVDVPFEYAPDSQRIPDGFGIVQMLANAVLRAKRPCGSIYSVGSLPQPAHGWTLGCDHKQHAYAVMLVAHDWKLADLGSAGP